MNTLWKGTLLMLPVVALATLTLLHTWNRAHGQEWRVPIAGFDPRDPLRGQYLQFQYEWNVANTSGARSCAGDDCALCTDDPTAFNPVVRMMPLDVAKQSCPSFIAGTVSNDRQEFRIGADATGLTRYFIPETEATNLQALLRRSNAPETPQLSMSLRVTRSGQAYIDRLYLDAVPLAQ